MYMEGAVAACSRSKPIAERTDLEATSETLPRARQQGGGITSTPMGFVAILGLIALSGMIIRNTVI
jgi:hypothetical protein